jgi:hypothetical protein
LRDFIEVRAEPARGTGGAGANAVPSDDPGNGSAELLGTPGPSAATEPRWSLWGDAEA